MPVHGAYIVLFHKVYIIALFYFILFYLFIYLFFFAIKISLVPVWT